MVMNNTPLSGLVGIVLTVVLIGTIAGLALSGTDLLNFNTSAAAARAQDQETEIEATKAAIDLQHYEAIQTARTEREKAELGMELEARQRELDQDLAHQRNRDAQGLTLARLTRYVVLALGALATLILSVALAVFLIQYGRSRLTSGQAEATRATSWHFPAWRAEQIRRAREREIAEREAALRQQAARKSTTGGNGRHPPKGEPVKIPER